MGFYIFKIIIELSGRTEVSLMDTDLELDSDEDRFLSAHEGICLNFYSMFRILILSHFYPFFWVFYQLTIARHILLK